jgi:hypothetical protein
VGIANNGDFAKIAGEVGLGVPQEGSNVARFAYLHYVFDPKFNWRSGFWSSELLLFTTALAANHVFGRTGTFDMRAMGAVHATLLLAAFWLLLPLLSSMTRALRWLVLALAAFFFTDVMYVSYLNSFYMDTAGLLFGLLAIVLFLRSLRWKRAPDRWFFVVALVLLITSKTQHYPLGLPAALFLLWKGHLLTPTRARAYVATAVILVAAATVFSANSAPPQYPAYACYTVIFSQILPHSKDVQRDLAELGLDPADARYIGTHAYAAEAGMRDPEFVTQFRRQTNYRKLASFFVKHPADALRAAETRLAEAGSQRPVYGNFDPSAGRPDFAVSKSFALWSSLKIALFNERGPRYLAYALLLALAAVLLAIAQRANLPPGMPEAVGTLALMFLLELAVGSFADALDATRQFLLFSALSDVLLITAICLVCTGAQTFFRPTTSLLPRRPRAPSPNRPSAAPRSRAPSPKLRSSVGKSLRPASPELRSHARSRLHHRRPRHPRPQSDHLLASRHEKNPGDRVRSAE